MLAPKSRTAYCNRLSRLLVAAVGGWYGLPSLHAQEVVEIDLRVGRVVVEDSTRAISTSHVTMDPVRGVLYLEDFGEPNVIIAFSFHTGEHLRTIAVPRGEEPNELPERPSGMAAVSDGGLFVAGVNRVLEFDPLGEVVGHWQPRTMSRRTVCEFGGEPAIPAMMGVVRRGGDGTDEFLGPRVLSVLDVQRMSRTESNSLGDKVWDAKIACGAEFAYVVSPNDLDQPDSVFAYGLDGGSESRFTAPVGPEHPRQFCDRTMTEHGRVVPLPCLAWHHRLSPSLDGNGNLVLLGKDEYFDGVIMDPKTQCYALLRSEPPGAAPLSRTVDCLG